MNEGTFELSVIPEEESDNIRIFNAEGNTVLTMPAIVDLNSPSGDLDVFLEGMKPNADLMIRLAFKSTGGTEICSDEIHLTIVKIDLFRDRYKTIYCYSLSPTS